jgi:5-methylcytosine-specific restriction endonuclease McrA
VHGDKVIRRRTGYKKQKDIQKYTNILKEDFQNMCGYCGKDLNIIKCPYQKDHLIPEKIAKAVGRYDLLTDYNNLVYSCRVCNRNKWDNWPFDNVDKTHDDKVGFVDPASKEYDEHLMRDEVGRIVPKTQVGSYMCEVLNFSNRLTDIWWKISAIYKEIIEIDGMLEKEKNIDGLTQYWMLHRQFDNFLGNLKKENESI